ncbi:MAG: hypothetical protein E6Q36_00065 [Chryseobacterium sp.]|nr:MAG: hypothetical protein E6Q36_00065 [Chryseobacterium sp.]
MMRINKPDLSAPRFRPTRHTIMNETFFSEFRKKYPQYRQVTDTKLREIINVHNELLWQAVIDNRDGAEFPEGLGYLFIGSCPMAKKFNVDYSSSIEKGVALRHRNFESDNYLAKIFYTNYSAKYRFKDRQLWQFKGVRDFTRKVGESYPVNWKMYMQVDNFLYISRVFRQKRKDQWILSNIVPEPEGYNEFDMN